MSKLSIGFCMLRVCMLLVNFTSVYAFAESPEEELDFYTREIYDLQRSSYDFLLIVVLNYQSYVDGELASSGISHKATAETLEQNILKISKKDYRNPALAQNKQCWLELSKILEMVSKRLDAKGFLEGAQYYALSNTLAKCSNEANALVVNHYLENADNRPSALFLTRQQILRLQIIQIFYIGAYNRENDVRLGIDANGLYLETIKAFETGLKQLDQLDTRFQKPIKRLRTRWKYVRNNAVEASKNDNYFDNAFIFRRTTDTILKAFNEILADLEKAG